MKKIIFLSVCSFLLQSIQAQNTFNCSSHERYLKQINSDPVFKRNQEQLEEETRLFMERNGNMRPSNTLYIIPVVFHIIYTTAAGNISDAQILDQMAILNQEFKRLQPDTALTPSAFKPFAAPFNVEFRLATIDPNGNCTNGINRVYSTLSNCSFDQDDVKKLSYWPSNKYLNVWIVQSMHYSGSLNCNGGGYGAFPGGDPLLDGINIRGDLISSIGTAITNQGWGNYRGRYLIHELGHWFNLRHIWGDANCGNDFVNDTPPAQTSNSGCPAFPHNAFVCPGSTADGEMYNDYMDYTNGPCLNMFTAGQVARMTACITSSVSGRSNVWSPANLVATGVSNPYTYPAPCAAHPDILPVTPQVMCLGDSVRFIDNSYGGSSTSRNWSFPGGSASSLSDSIVRVRYNAVGLYTISLTKNYQSSSKTGTFINRVQVVDNVPNANYSAPFSDSFETPSFFNSDWIVVNNDNDSAYWELNYNTAYSGAYCVGIMNFGMSAPLTDDLISPAYDLTTISSPTLSFRLNFANCIAADYDKLVVFISNNCGKTWQQIYSRSAPSTLNTEAGLISSSNVPDFASDSAWRLERINIQNSWANATARFKFSFTSGGGNNIFIDDINIAGVRTGVGLAELTKETSLTLYPNPASDRLQLKLNNSEATLVQVELVDVLGKTCLSQNTSTASDGSLTLNVRALKAGVYFASVKQADGKTFTAKFIKQDLN